jgi:hypothetical protein
LTHGTLTQYLSRLDAIALTNSQAQGVILDLRNTSVTLEDLGNVMARLEGSGGTNIKEVIVINKDETVTYLLRVQR